jgi:hypothetical protein
VFQASNVVVKLFSVAHHIELHPKASYQLYGINVGAEILQDH